MFELKTYRGLNLDTYFQGGPAIFERRKHLCGIERSAHPAPATISLQNGTDHY